MKINQIAFTIRESNQNDIRIAIKQIPAADLTIIMGPVIDNIDITVLYEILDLIPGRKIIYDMDLVKKQKYIHFAEILIDRIKVDDLYIVTDTGMKPGLGTCILVTDRIEPDLTANIILSNARREFNISGKLSQTGPLVQEYRNIVKHGGITWNIQGGGRIPEATIFYVKIPAKITLYANKDKLEIPDLKWVDVQSFSFVHSNCSPEFIKKIINQYKPDSIIGESGEVGLNAHELKMHELFFKTHKSDVPELVPLHKEMYAKYSGIKSSVSGVGVGVGVGPGRQPYKLIHLQWSNLMCYGTGNWIDFSEFRGVINLVGENKKGKSSIIDILMYVLFNEVLRGDKKSIIGKDKTEYDVKCEIDIMGTRYVIHRSAGIVQLYSKPGGVGMNWINQSGKNLTETYDIISSMIGSDKEMLRMCIANQDRIMFQTSNAILHEFKYYLKLDAFDNIEKMVKEDITNLNKEIKTLEKNKLPDVRLLPEPNENTRREKESRLSELVAARDSLRIWIVSDPSSLINLLRDAYLKWRGSVGFTEVKLQIRYPKPYDVVLYRITDASKLIGLDSEINRILEEEVKLSAGLQYTAELDDLRKRVAAAGSIVGSKQEEDIKKEIEQVNTDLIKMGPKKNIFPPMSNEQIDMFKTKIGIEIQNRRDWIKLVENDQLVPGTQEEEKRYNQGINSFKFNENCDACKLARKIKISRSEAVNLILKYNREIQKLETKINDLTDLSQDVIRDSLNMKLTGLQTQLSYIQDRNKLMELEKIESRNITIKQEKLALDKKLAELRGMRELKIYNDNYIRLIEQINNWNESGDSQIKREEMDIEINKLRTWISDADKIQIENRANEKIVDMMQKSRIRLDSLISRVKLLKTYLSMLGFGPGGLSYHFFKQYAEKIEQMINTILCRITDFKIHFNLDKFDVLVNNGVSISQASGFQKFIVDICFRLALIADHPYMPKILIIDEGFGCMDLNHLDKVGQFFRDFSDLRIGFDFIILISHIDKLQKIGKPIRFEPVSIGGGSKISSGREKNYTLGPVKMGEDDLPIVDGKYYCKRCGKSIQIKSGAARKHVESKSHNAKN